MQDMLLVLNFDTRYARALAMRLRLERIDCRILPGDTSLEAITQLAPMGLVLAGGVTGDIPAQLDGRLLSAGMPMLAMGDASPALCSLLGGRAGEPRDIHDVETVSFLPGRLTDQLAQSERYLTVLRPLTLGAELQPLARCQEDTVGFAHKALPLFGFGFQLEQNDPDAMGILMRFAQEICGCSQWLTETAFISASKEEIAEAVGDGQALCVLTGGLDSAVAALIASRALGDRLHCLMVDTGLLREGEADDFLAHFRQTQGLDITLINAQDRFHEALTGLLSAQEKADAIARVYRQVIDEAAAERDFDALVRGVSANELLREGQERSLPDTQYGRRVLAPLRELFKEEIRAIGAALGLPQDIYQAQPFPGTGLALRIQGEATRQRLGILRKADAIFRDEIKQAGLGRKLWKYFAMLYPLPEDGSEQAVALALRASTIGTVDGKVRTLPARLPYDLLERCTSRVMQAFPEVRRVVNDITPGSSYSQEE